MPKLIYNDEDRNEVADTGHLYLGTKGEEADVYLTQVDTSMPEGIKDGILEGRDEYIPEYVGTDSDGKIVARITLYHYVFGDLEPLIRTYNLLLERGVIYFRVLTAVTVTYTRKDKISTE